MSYSYSSIPPFPPARRDYSNESSSFLDQIREIPQWIAEMRASPRAAVRGSRDLKSTGRRLLLRVTTLANALILLWVWTLWWGERRVFQESMDSCAWDIWEDWPPHAKPHHVAFIADPQLVDPHTYPGRQWPLSTLTVKFTDQYLRRSFSSIQRNLGPDSVLFLGDLFDGGREWATGSTSSSEARYRKYKDSFWKQEYDRFSRIFTDQFNQGDKVADNPRGRKMIASLPGNHDLGFGSGIQIPVRDRFVAFFGNGNRVEVLGNHTFVSVDTVSLSAMDQPDPKTGSTGAGSGDGEQPNEAIWKEAADFLNNMNVHRGKAEKHELQTLQNQSEGWKFRREAVDVGQSAVDGKPQPEVVGLPTILLTHVPLYRKAATPCGPYREHYPPSSDEKLEEDEQNALKISGGYQYQNVLTQTISNEMVTKIGPNLVHVYSGDDHDYCEIAHREFSGSPKEITVKSLSWAMGVRKPGFVMTSLWNPINPRNGKPLKDITPTVQSHLCLLPDQLSVFIWYGVVLAFTLAILLARAIMAISYPSSPESDTTNTPILPLSETRPRQPGHTKKPSSSTSSATPIAPHGLASRATAPRYNDYGFYGEDEKDEVTFKEQMQMRGLSGGPGGVMWVGIVGWEVVGSIWVVARVVVGWYAFLIWRW